MLIQRELCTACGSCLPYCPVSAIKFKGKGKVSEGEKPFAFIDEEECVECGVCFRAKVCPTDAIVRNDLSWPRVLRRAFSDPFFEHKGTNVPGRGTEEMKTNDVTGRYKEGFVGVGLEFGRPGVGTYLGEIEPAIRTFLTMGFSLEPLNPLTQLVEDPSTGRLKEEVRKERVLSAIVEFVAPVERLKEVGEAIKRLEPTFNTTVCVDLIVKIGKQDPSDIIGMVKGAGFSVRPNTKVNIGLGRPLIE